MKTANHNETVKETETVLDLNTIRTRVEKIKAGWNSETAKQRAEEGKRRRAELERMLLGNNVACKSRPCDFSLVV